MDSLTFGARRFLRHLTDLGYKKSLVTEFEVSKVASHAFSLSSFILLSILVIVYDFPGFG
jgi:flap endonuclease-1